MGLRMATIARCPYRLKSDRTSSPPASPSGSHQPAETRTADGLPFGQKSEPDPREKYSIWLLAAGLVAFAVVWAFFSEHAQSYDDLHLFNISYMYAHYGVLTYPVHGQFHNLTLHPPIHHWELGALMKAGVPIYYAEAIVPFFFLLLAVWFICRSPFPSAVKIGFFLALCVPFLNDGFSPRIRPDLHRALALFAGLVALESGRLRQWDWRQLFLGSLLLTYSASLHYPGFLAWTGALVYLLWVLRDRGWNEGRSPALALMAGGCVVGIPCLLFFVIPEWNDIARVITEVDPMGGFGASLRVHLEVYANLYSGANSLEWLWPIRILFLPLGIGIPVIALSTAALWSNRNTRGMALASLPYPVFLLTVVANHKLHWSGYFLPELMLYVAGIGMLVTSALYSGVGRLLPRWRWLAIPAAGLALMGSLLASSPVRHTAELSLRPRVNEDAVARAAGRAMLGPGALVGTSTPIMFYASGATHYFDVAQDLLVRPEMPDNLIEYFDGFDAIVENWTVSEQTSNQRRESLTSWYVNGVLSLRGFYFSPRHNGLDYLVLHPRPAERIQGYAAVGNREVLHFQQQADGAYIFVGAVCTVGTKIVLPFVSLPRPYRLPLDTAALPQKELITFVAKADDYLPQRPMLSRQCAVREEVRLQRETLDSEQLLATLRADQDIHFYLTREDALEGRHGPEASISVDANGWPSGLRFLRGRRQGEEYSFTDVRAREVLRSEMDNTAGWEAYRRGYFGSTETVPDGVSPGSPATRFYSWRSADSLTSRFVDWNRPSGSLVFFSVWAKPLTNGRLPRLMLQDQQLRQLAEAKPRVRREDGWVLLAGWFEDDDTTRARVRISQYRRTTSLLDKVLVVELPRTPQAER